MIAFGGSSELVDRVLGCLIGGAMGDALGAPVEFLSIEEIQKRYGQEGIQEYDKAYGIRGAITDDTQMMIATGAGILEARTEDPQDVLDSVWIRYQQWLRMQQTVPALRRAPGNTCMSALEGGKPGSIAGPLNDSKGCGGVMRIAPIAVLDSPCVMGCRTAALTHGHTSGYLPAGFLAGLLRDLFRGVTLRDAVTRGFAWIRGADDHLETYRIVHRAWRLAVYHQMAPKTVPELADELGAGWTGHEALAIALYCALVAKDFPSGIRMAVNHSGDSDSTGAIAGNILGAAYGARYLPGAWHRYDRAAAVVIPSMARELAQRMLDRKIQL